ncbi:MAG: terpene cyclase/mutase family protein, partial [Planctomycetales bacterium]
MRKTTRRDFLAGSAAGGLFATHGLPSAWAIDDKEFNSELEGGELIIKAQQSINKGLKYLKSRQNRDDGSFGSRGYSRNVAVCGLSGLAFMASGSTPNRGPHGEQVEKCVRFLLDHAQDDGFITVPGSTSHGPMYGHGFAVLFLAECYGMTMRGDIREKLSKAVRLIEKTQNDEGGWRYQPRRGDADLSVTICQIMALRAARNAGIYVKKETIDACIEFVKQCQNPDGGF